MFATIPPDGRRRALAGALVLSIHGLALIALAMGGGARVGPVADEVVRMFDVAPPEIPPPVIPPPEAPTPASDGLAAAGAGAPAGPPVAAPEITAPVPIVPLPTPVTAPPAIAPPAPTVGLGIEGAGSGTGRGGTGGGAGTGDAGTGTGDGGPLVRTRRIAGSITSRDYPRAAERAGIAGNVTVRLAIDAAGRVADCRLERSGGHPALDETTCTLIRNRFRFAPARDGAGRAVPDSVFWEQVWTLDRSDDPRVAEATCRARTEELRGSARRAAINACMAELGWTR